MFKPKKTIPTLVVGAMALFGCGDDPGGAFGGFAGFSGGGGGGGSGGGSGGGGSAGAGGIGGAAGTGGTGGAPDQLTAALNAFCMKFVECYSNYTMEYCLSEYGAYVSDYVNTECADELQSYFSCGSMITCQDFTSDINSCADEFDAFAACVFD